MQLRQTGGPRRAWRVHPSPKHLNERFVGQRIAKHFIKYAECRTPRFASRAVTAREPERSQMHDTSEVTAFHQQKLATPDGAVIPQSGAIPGDSKHRSIQVIVGHTRQDVRKVMLNRHSRDGQPFRVLRGCIIRVSIAGNADDWLFV
jgi:hypothetical protein